MPEHHPLRFTALPHGFQASGPGQRACFMEAKWSPKARAINWSWRIHSVDMQTLLADGNAATPEEAEATMRAWLEQHPRAGTTVVATAGAA